MNNINVIKERQRADDALAGEVMTFAAHAQFNENGFIKDDTDRYQAILEAARGIPMFEGCPEEFVGTVANAWASGMADYANKNGKYPSAELLANAHRSLSRLLTEAAPGKVHQGFNKGMFESAQQAFMEAAYANEPNGMHTSPGVMRLALFAALILPVALGATTADAVTFVPCERDESDIYRIYQIAASNFGDYQIGDILDMQSAGVYSQFHRHAVFDTQKPDGTKTTFVFNTYEADAAFVKSKTALPIRAGRVRLLINRMPTYGYDDGMGNLIVDITDPSGIRFTGKATIDYAKGIVTLDMATGSNASPVLKTTDEIAVTYELDVETMPSLIPLVNQKMTKWTVKPSQYALATEYTVQALMDAQREFGLDLSSQLFNGARNWLSHETDVKRLREILFHTVYTGKIAAGYPNQQQMDAYLMTLRRQLGQESNKMVQRTLTTGIRGGFAGSNVANFFKSLPASVWTPAPGYQESPYIQFAGTLFGSIRIYEVPQKCCALLTKTHCQLSEDECVFYGRGDNIGDAGLIAGDAVPAIPFVHPTTPQLVNRTTLWGSAINLVHPDHGEDYFVRVNFSGKNTGDTFNMVDSTYANNGANVTP